MRHEIQGASPQAAKTSANQNAEGATERPAIARVRTRECVRSNALRNAVQKRANGVPTYTVSETAALLSISQEYLYRLIQAGGFPAVRMRIGGGQGRYVVPAKAVEQVLDHATSTGDCVEVLDWSQSFQTGNDGGVA